jgi:hypothetical protein
MLGLNLRQEFKGKRLKGTAIELSNESNTGATQIAAAEFLEITYLIVFMLHETLTNRQEYSSRGKSDAAERCARPPLRAPSFGCQFVTSASRL